MGVGAVAGNEFSEVSLVHLFKATEKEAKRFFVDWVGHENVRVVDMDDVNELLEQVDFRLHFIHEHLFRGSKKHGLRA